MLDSSPHFGCKRILAILRKALLLQHSALPSTPKFFVKLSEFLQSEQQNLILQPSLTFCENQTLSDLTLRHFNKWNSFYFVAGILPQSLFFVQQR